MCALRKPSMQKGFKTEVLKPFKHLQREAEESISRA